MRCNPCGTINSKDVAGREFNSEPRTNFPFWLHFKKIPRVGFVIQGRPYHLDRVFVCLCNTIRQSKQNGAVVFLSSRFLRKPNVRAVFMRIHFCYFILIMELTKISFDDVACKTSQIDLHDLCFIILCVYFHRDPFEPCNTAFIIIHDMKV